MMRSGRVRTLLILIAAPLLVYLALVNIADRITWKVPSDGIPWAEGKDGVEVAAVSGIQLPPEVSPGDILIDINGIRVRSLDDYAEITEVLTRGVRKSVVVDYTFRHAGTAGEVTVPVELTAAPQIGVTDIPLILVAFVFFSVGVLTLLRNARAAGAHHFAVVCLVAFMLLVFRTSGRADTFDLLVYWLAGSALLLLPPLFLHFALCFPEPVAVLRQWPKRVYVVYAPAAVLGLIQAVWFTGRLQVFGLARTHRVEYAFDKVELVQFVVYFVLAALVFMKSRRPTATVVERKQLRWIASGSLLGILPFGLMYAVPYLLGLPVAHWMEASVLSLALIPFSFGYAISKFRLADVDLIFKRGAAYVVASSALLAFYVAVALLIGRTVQNLSPQSSFLLLAVSALAVAALFAPLRDRIQETLDRYFYKDRYGYRRSFQDFARSLGSEIQLSRLTERMTDRIQRTLDVSPVAIFLRDERTAGEFRLQTAAGLVASDQPFTLRITGPVLSELAGDRLGFHLDAGGEDLAPVRESLSPWGIQYVEPLVVRGRLIGLLALGHRPNGDYLTSEDLEMVSGLAGYAAIAIDNATLYHSLESKAAELMQLRIYSDSVIESISLGVAVVTAEGRITVWNGAMSELMGMTRESVLNREISEVLPSGLVDVLEGQLQQAERLSSIGLFAAGIAHEVNTPLAGISSYAQMLLDETPKSDPNRELLERIEQQSFRASEILNNLLNFARFSERDFEEVNLNNLMLDTLSLLEHQFKKSAVEVDLDFEPTLPNTLGNGGKLQQVFMNLFLNARDAMPRGGRLKLVSRSVNSELLIQIQDSGTGISREDIQRIYDPFFTTKAVGEGTGLGLSVTYGIIQEHSGRISVDSVEGKGTTFSLYFPLKRVH
ncbi:MAG: ATP-binding protein [Acidobacteriota bacterium]